MNDPYTHLQNPNGSLNKNFPTKILAGRAVRVNGVFMNASTRAFLKIQMGGIVNIANPKVEAGFTLPARVCKCPLTLARTLDLLKARLVFLNDRDLVSLQVLPGDEISVTPASSLPPSVRSLSARPPLKIGREIPRPRPRNVEACKEVGRLAESGTSAVEIAHKLGMSISTVYTRLHQWKKYVQHELETVQKGEEETAMPHDDIIATGVVEPKHE